MQFRGEVDEFGTHEEEYFKDAKGISTIVLTILFIFF